MEEHQSSPKEGDERIGAYRVLRLLGRGGMGEVFLAQDDRLKRRVAIKRIRRDSGLHPDLRRRLLREARAAASLNHPAIVQIYDLIDDPAGDCLVLEYAAGKTLTATLADSPLELRLALRLAREVAEALAAAHAAGIVHRDLKSENVIVTLSGHAKVLDFGLARMRGATGEVLVTEHGVVIGTYHTMSPEQASGGEADERSDLFSLGVLLYEMLTGRSPFRGANPLESLRRVISEHPPCVDTVRPEVPARLGALVDRLLAKDPAARPQYAAEVARELAGIEASLPPSDPSSTETVSDQPTGFFVLKKDALQQPLPRSSAAPTSTAGMSVLPRRRFAAVAALGVLILALVGAAAFVLNQRPEKSVVRAQPPRPLRVVVPQPEVDGKDDRLGLAASGVLAASLNTLGSLQSVTPIDPIQILGSPKSAIDIARSAGANEILAATLGSSGNLGRITLRRIRGSDGSSLWTDSFDASLEAHDLRLLADAVGIHLRRGYPQRTPKSGPRALEVRDEDYAAFLAIKQRLGSGKVPSPDDLTSLERIIAASPRFPEARVFAATLLLNRFQSTKEIVYRNRALELVRQARDLAPDDPDPLITQFSLELAGERPEIAAATLARIEKLLPGDPTVLFLRADLADRQGRMDDALADKRLATERLPSWRNLLRLADLEARTGHVEEARGYLQKILAGSPDNIWALDKLAEIELLFGDLHRAEQLYQEMIARTPRRSHLTNLGIIRVLVGRYEDAIAAFRQALAIDPDHAYATLNLAEAELALGRTRDSETNFRKVLRKIAENRTPAGLSAADNLVQAQCLVHLGRRREAVEIARSALRQNPKDSDVLQSAALVYAVAGERVSALDAIETALRQGVKPRWFLLPAFNSLRADPEFRSLLARAPGAPSEKGLPATTR
jgi:serine/threonine protein kinase/tetratricopeptide (TPR) repeat protein